MVRTVAPSEPAGISAVSVAVVCQPTNDGGRAMRFDRAVGQRGMAAAGTRCRGGGRGQHPCRHYRCRGMRRCRMAPLWYQVRLARPGLLGRHRALPGRRRRSRRLQRSRDKGVQPETERHHQRQRECHGPAQSPPSRTSGRRDWLTRSGRADLVLRRRTAGRYQTRHRGQGRPPPPRSLGRRGQQFLQADCRQDVGRPADRVVLLDQRRWVGPHGLGDAADVPPRVEVAAAPGVVVAFDPPDDRFPDPGLLTDLGNGETGSLARFRQGRTDGHAAPPQLCHPAYPLRPGGGAIRPHHFTRPSRWIGRSCRRGRRCLRAFVPCWAEAAGGSAAPALAVPAGVAARWLVSEMIARPRPPAAIWLAGPGGDSLPSRHTTIAALTAGAVAAAGASGRCWA